MPLSALCLNDNFCTMSSQNCASFEDAAAAAANTTEDIGRTAERQRMNEWLMGEGGCMDGRGIEEAGSFILTTLIARSRQLACATAKPLIRPLTRTMMSCSDLM